MIIRYDCRKRLQRTKETTYLYVITYIYILYIIIYIYTHRRHGQSMFPFQIFSNMTSIHWKGLGVSVLTLKGLETMESSGDGGRCWPCGCRCGLMPQEEFAEDCAAEAAFAELFALIWV